MAHISILFLSSANSEKNNIKVAWVHNPKHLFNRNPGTQTHEYIILKVITPRFSDFLGQGALGLF